MAKVNMSIISIPFVILIISPPAIAGSCQETGMVRCTDDVGRDATLHSLPETSSYGVENYIFLKERGVLSLNRKALAACRRLSFVSLAYPKSLSLNYRRTNWPASDLASGKACILRHP
jgi:hypothetical protein